MRKDAYCRIFPALAALVFLMSGCSGAGTGANPEGGSALPAGMSETAANASDEADEKSTIEISECKNISFYVIEAAYNGAEICIENNSGQAVYPASAVSLEKKTDGEWYKMKPAYTYSYSGRIWESKPIYFVGSGDSGKGALNWSGYYGDLPAGDYRIIREFFSDSGHSSGNITLACEFSVTQSPKTIEAIQAEIHEKELEEVWDFVAAASAEIGGKSDAKTSERNDVLYSVTEASSDHIITSIENNGEATLCWGSDASVEKEIDGEWYTLIPIELPEDFASLSNAMLYSSEPGDTRTEGFYWSWYYGNLAPGHYRVIKVLFFDDRSSPPDLMALAAEFTVE